VTANLELTMSYFCKSDIKKDVYDFTMFFFYPTTDPTMISSCSNVLKVEGI